MIQLWILSVSFFNISRSHFLKCVTFEKKQFISQILKELRWNWNHGLSPKKCDITFEKYLPALCYDTRIWQLANSCDQVLKHILCNILKSHCDDLQCHKTEWTVIELVFFILIICPVISLIKYTCRANLLAVNSFICIILKFTLIIL